MLRERILDQEPSRDKFLLVEEWLSDRFDKSKIPPTDLLNTIGQLQNESVGNYQKIIENYPKTQKHLIDQFKKYVGLTPK